MEIEHIITEFEEIVLVEEAYKPMKEARLSTLRMEEVLEYLNNNKFLKEAIEFNSIKERMFELADQFNSLEKDMGVKDREDFVIGEVETHTLNMTDLVDKIFEYIKIKALIDEQTSELLYVLRDYLYSRAMMTVNEINEIRPGAALNYVATILNDTSLGLNKVSLEYDKIITYKVDSNIPEFKELLKTDYFNNKSKETRSFDYRITFLYDEIALLYKNSMELNKFKLEVESLVQSEKLTYFLFLFGLITVVLTAFTSLITYFSFFGVKDINELFKLFINTLIKTLYGYF